MRNRSHTGVYALMLIVGLVGGMIAGMESQRRGMIENVSKILGIAPHTDTSSVSAPAPATERVRVEDRVDNSRHTAIVEATRRIEQSVVGIVVTQLQVVGSSYYYEDFFNLFIEPKQMPRYREVQNMGSGFVIDPRGFILTNNHVVESARKLFINFPDGRQFEGTVVGADPFADIAVVSVKDPKGEFPAVKVGNSSDLMTGEWAIAVGNPFLNFFNDAQPTVTLGVVSALHRSFAPADNVYYEDMIQTDAAINPGNSGGPLCNALGEVIGINSFIYTGSRRDKGSIGIGFAIPINTAMRVAHELIEHGKRRQVYTGIGVQDLDRSTAMSIGYTGNGGVLVTDVVAGSPGAEAGLHAGDVIIGMDKRRIDSHQDLDGVFLCYFPGDKISVKAVRAGVEKTLVLTLKELVLQKN